MAPSAASGPEELHSQGAPSYAQGPGYHAAVADEARSHNDVELLEPRSTGRIRTSHDPKPIPSRQFDWTATSANYDASLEGDSWVANEPVGYGATKEEAIADLQAQLDEDDFAPLTVPEDEEPHDRYGERARLMSQYGLREKDFF
jgi:hypothetical protein